MNQEKLIIELLNILYDAQVNGKNIPNQEFFEFQNKVGKEFINEIIHELRDKEWTKLGSEYSPQNDNLMLATGKPYITIKGIEYLEEYKKPFWKKLKFTHFKEPISLIGTIIAIIVGIITICHYLIGK